jgi:hypothetical protein
LRHNGNGLVWLRSGVSVHEADHDAGISGKDKTKGRVNGLPFELSASGRNTRLNAALPFQYLRNYGASITRTMPHSVRQCMRLVMFGAHSQTDRKDGVWLYVTGSDKGLSQQNRALQAARQLSRPYLSLIRGLNVWHSMVNGSTSTQITSAF